MQCRHSLAMGFDWVESFTRSNNFAYSIIEQFEQLIQFCSQEVLHHGRFDFLKLETAVKR
jgi:hypothetical protein